MRATEEIKLKTFILNNMINMVYSNVSYRVRAEVWNLDGQSAMEQAGLGIHVMMC
jgi:hypothetical protein